MPDPAVCNVSAAEATAAKVRESAETTLRATRHFRGRLQDEWRRMSSRVAEARARLPMYRQELREDTARVAERARYYHQTQPLNALGAIAATAFVLGIAIGFGRR